jgi:hypothetical protein
MGYFSFLDSILLFGFYLGQFDRGTGGTLSLSQLQHSTGTANKHKFLQAVTFPVPGEGAKKTIFPDQSQAGALSTLQSAPIVHRQKVHDFNAICYANLLLDLWGNHSSGY